MPNTFAAHLAEVRAHYAARDYNLAYRRLLDAAIETRQPHIFKAVLAYADWLEAHEAAPLETATSKALDVLAQIESAGVADMPTGSPHILSVQNLSKRYASGAFSLSDVSLELNEGGIIGLVGENGNGKTTLLRLLATELRPDSGTIRYPFISDADDDYDLKTRLIYIEQRIPKWWGSLMDNLQFALAHYGLHGGDNLLWAQLMIARLGLRPFRNHTWARLSSGYRTRFELAKTLLRQPKILLLDEPLANLDILSQQTILQDLRFMARSITAPFGMLLSSQHIYEVEKVSDSIIFLKNGKPQYGGMPVAEGEAVPQAAAPLIYELEISGRREDLEQAFKDTGLMSLHFNGGVFIAQFSGGTAEGDVLNALAGSGIGLLYLRNITHSSRRFFLN